MNAPGVTGPAANSRTANSPAGNDRTEVRLTPALVVLVILLSVTAGLRPAVASPTVTAALWSGLAALVILGVVWPLVDRRGRTLEFTAGPADAIEGAPFAVGLRTRRSGNALLVDLDDSLGTLGTPVRPGLPGAPGPTGESGLPGGPGRPGDGEPSAGVLVNSRTMDASAVVHRRGVYATLAVRVVDSGPFGLLRVTRHVDCALPQRLHVGPREEPCSPEVDSVERGVEEAPWARAASVGDTVRSVRPYVAGDPAHLVHWPTSAHVGQLMVMELEPPGDQLVAVVVDLRGGAPVMAEQAVRRAAGAVRRALDEWMRVVLCTATDQGPLTSEVHTMFWVRRYLAAAVPGVPGAVPDGCSAMVFTSAGLTPPVSGAPASGSEVP